jgi:hypothetical protein
MFELPLVAVLKLAARHSSGSASGASWIMVPENSRGFSKQSTPSLIINHIVDNY